jgi:diaminohydroxyphosphoribosylaminopyrimidine deaminase/5-amino-6-(5-phosphoribosylamino)uracil reductase
VPSFQKIANDQLADLALSYTLGDEISSEECESLAVQVALKGAGCVAPNPLVGAVAVDENGLFLASGAHLKFGGPHAEVQLIESIRKTNKLSSLKGATLYVTLEPCAHQGQTPSCAQFLTKFLIKKIVYAFSDPNPLVNGGGVKILQNSGIECVQSERFQEKSKDLVEVFFHHIQKKKPFFALKIACTLNGVYAQIDNDNDKTNGKSKRLWITSDRSRKYGHWLRQFYDSIMVAWGTVLSDNPSLNARHGLKTLTKRDPVKIIFDPYGKIFLDKTPDEIGKLAIFSSDSKVIWVCQKLGWRKCNDQVDEIFSQYSVERITLFEDLNSKKASDDFAHKLADLGVGSVLVEGGAFIWAQIIRWNLADKIHLFQSTKIFSGKNSLHWARKLSVEEEVDLCHTKIIPLGGDYLVEATVEKPTER